MSTPKISLINIIGTPPNYPSKHTLAITESGPNIHISKKVTTKTTPVIMSNNITERIPYGSTMELSHIAKINIPDLSKQARQIHIPPKMKTAPIISLGVLCDYGCTITLDKQDMSVLKNGQQIIKGARNKQTWMC